MGDIDECVELYKDVFSSDPWNDKWISIDQVKNYFNELIENPVFEGFVAYENSKLIAACFGHKRSWWTGNDFFIDELFVANEMQEMELEQSYLNMLSATEQWMIVIF